MKKTRLGKLPVEQGPLTELDIEQALVAAGEARGRLSDLLAANQSISRADIGAGLEAVNGIPYVKCPPPEIAQEVLALIPAGLAARSCALPIAIRGHSLIVVMAEPQHYGVVRDLQFASGMQVEPRFGFRSDIIEGIMSFYGEQVQDPPNEQASVAVPADPGLDRVPGHVSRGAVLALFAACALAAAGTWQAANLIFGRFDGDHFVEGEAIPFLEDHPGANLIPQAQANSAFIPPLSATALTGNEADAGRSETGPPAASDVHTALPVLPDNQPGPGAEIQVGAFRSQGNAYRLAENLGRLHSQVGVTVSPGGLFVVGIGPLPDKATADRIASDVREQTGLDPLVRLTGTP